MTDTATPVTGPVDAPASLESVTAEFEAGAGEAAPDALESVTEQLVNEAEGNGQPGEGPGTEEDATDPDAAEPQPEEGNPEVNDEANPFNKLLAENPDLKVKIKVNGETIEVPLSDLPNGYSRTEDYKAKTAAVAEARREAETLRANAEADAKAEYANKLEEATNLFSRFDPLLAEASRIDWQALKAADPAAFVQAQDAVNERLAAIQHMQSEVQRLRGEAQTHQQTQLETERAERFDKTAEAIVKANPELADEAKFRAYADTNIAFLREAGFTQDEIVDALDPRVMTLADEARQWRAHKAAQKSLPEKKVVPKSAVKPLTSDGSSSSQSKPRFPGHASREAKGNWIAEQILSEE